MQSDPTAIDDLIVVSRTETRIAVDPVRLAQARAQFARTSVVVLRGVLAPSLLAWVRQSVASGEFRRKVHAASGVEDCMVNNEAIWMLRFLLGAPDVLRLVEAVTGQQPLTKAQLRVYRFLPGTDHAHDWHDDLGEGRRLGLSVNLSDTMFEGGRLQLRQRESGEVLSDVHNTGAGDAAIFRLGRDVQHRVLPVTGAFPRVALAGWFRE